MELEKLEELAQLLTKTAMQFPVALRELKEAVRELLTVMDKLGLPVPVEFPVGSYRVRRDWGLGRDGVVVEKEYMIRCSNTLEEMEVLLQFPNSLIEWLKRVDEAASTALALARALRRALEDEEVAGELALRGLVKDVGQPKK